MKTYVANVVIKNPQLGVNRDSVAVPPGFRLRSIIAFLPPNSLLDVKDNNRSIFGKNPVGGGIFNTLTRSLNFPHPVEVQTAELDVQIELLEPSAEPIFITFIGEVQ
ncbi:MAG: hypothetical protein GXN96_01415 [Aquificae bacterium]|nr:hypothetical protein [Aquificota bacterium]